MREWLHDLGLDGPNIVAGFSGGIVRVIFDHAIRPWEVAGALAAGALTANYLGGPVADMLHLPPLGTAFIVGFGGLQVAATILNSIRSKIGGSTPQQEKGPANVA
jgi:hypothetical protein